ncbi:11344_t:CDS:2, partial [Funneliformis geosporum]
RQKYLISNDLTAKEQEIIRGEDVVGQALWKKDYLAYVENGIKYFSQKEQRESLMTAFEKINFGELVKALELQADIKAKQLTEEEAVRIYSTLNLNQIPVSLNESLKAEGKGGQPERTIGLVNDELGKATEYSTLKRLYRELESFGSDDVMVEGELGFANNKIADCFFEKYNIRDNEDGSEVKVKIDSLTLTEKNTLFTAKNPEDVKEARQEIINERIAIKTLDASERKASRNSLERAAFQKHKEAIKEEFEKVRSERELQVADAEGNLVRQAEEGIPEKVVFPLTREDGAVAIGRGLMGVNWLIGSQGLKCGRCSGSGTNANDVNNAITRLTNLQTALTPYTTAYNLPETNQVQITAKLKALTDLRDAEGTDADTHAA